MAHATLTPEVETVLRQSSIEGNVLTLPPGQLERKLYESVNKVIVNCGGKWNRSVAGYVFPSDPRAKLGIALDTGVAEDTKKTLQAFYTPAAVAARVVELAEVNGKIVLEPSCGEGALIAECLAQGALFVHGIELDNETSKKAAARLVGKPVSVYCRDFLNEKPGTLGFERIVANPPFTRGQDTKHLAHMLHFLAPSGVLVSVMSPMAPTKPTFLKATAGYHVSIEEVAAGAFKESGTPIRTVIVKIVAP